LYLTPVILTPVIPLAHTKLVLAYDHLLRVQKMNALAPDDLRRLEAMKKGIQQLKALSDDR